MFIDSVSSTTTESRPEMLVEFIFYFVNGERCNLNCVELLGGCFGVMFQTGWETMDVCDVYFGT